MVRTDHEGRSVGRPLGPVGERSGDREVAVEADDEKVEHAGVAGQIVEGQPGVADVGAEGPVAQQRRHGEQRHRYQPYREVRHGQAGKQNKLMSDQLYIIL